jgi:hypothetical protein
MTITQKPVSNNRSLSKKLLSALNKKFRGVFLLLLTLFTITGSYNASAQADSVYWTFGTSGTAMATATGSTYAGVPAAACLADTGNVSGPFTSTSGYSTLYFTTQFPSSGYPAASGEPTMRNNAKAGSMNAATSTFFSFTITPNPGATVEIKQIHFAGLKGATGPTSYTIRTSLDGYTANVATGSFSTSYGSAKKVHTGLSLQGGAGTAITVRIYVHNPIVTTTGGNVFIDDVVIYYDATGGSITPGITTGSVSSSLCGGSSVMLPFTAAGTYTPGNTFTAQLSDASGSFSSPVAIGSLSGTSSGNINITIPANTPVGSAYRIRVVSNTPVLTGSDNGTDIAIAPLVIPTVTVSPNPGSTICAGTSATFTANITNGGTTPTYQWKKNGVNVGTNSSTYTDNGITNGNNITVELTSNATCATPATVTATPVSMTVNASAANSVTITSTASTICVGTSVTFTANVPTVSSGPLVSIPGSNLTCTQGMTATSSCVSGYYANGWTGSGYWQYQINTTGYQNIVFNTATSSSGTGPHNGIAYYSTNGTTYTLLPTSAYSFSGTSCSSTGNITLPAAADNQPTLYIRLIMTGASAGTGTNRVSVDAFKGQVLQAGFTPVYQWKKNSTNVGTNSSTYTDNGLVNNDDVWVEVSAATCVTPAVSTSNIITTTVNPVVVPSLSIAANATTICAGTSVTLTATPVNGGASPAYQWKVNGLNVGTNSGTYTSTTLANNDVVTCQMTSNAACPSPVSATSNGVTMTVNPNLTPSVSVTSTSSAICAGTSVTFTASPTNGGASPSYQWKKNSVNVGTNSATYTDNTLANNDVVTVVMTSSVTCVTSPTATGNNITMTVSVPLTPSITALAGTGNTICNGTAVTFTATPTNGGASPSYQWKKNSINVGANSATYNDNALANGDVITVVMTSNAVCLAAPSGTSAPITMTVNPIIVPSVSVTVGPNDTICDGVMTTFTAIPVNEGTAPIYQWKKNNVNVGSGGTTYTDNTFINGDIVTFTMASSATCATPANVTSAPVTMTVNPLLPTSVSIMVTPNDTFCAGTAVTFLAKFTNGGIIPKFQWKKNNVNVGGNGTSTIYLDNTLMDGDKVSVTMTSDAVCATPAVISSQLPVAVTVGHVYNPQVTLVAKPGVILAKNEMVFFTAYITDAGANPKIHWEVNGQTIPGIKADNYFSSILSNNDTVVCIVESTDTCSIGNVNVSNALVMKIGTGVGNVTDKFENITLFPNPNTGTFNVKGSINTKKDVKIEVLNALGQTVYSSALPVINNLLNQHIALPETAKGTYLMRIHAEGQQKVLRFIIQ